MKQFILALAIAATVMACNNNTGYKVAEDGQEAATEFIKATLEGNYDKASFYMYKDSLGTNQMVLDKWKKDYDLLPNADKVRFKNASIIVKNIEKANDSLVNFTYVNSYRNIQQTIKVIRDNNIWLVDLKDIH